MIHESRKLTIRKKVKITDVILLSFVAVMLVIMLIVAVTWYYNLPTAVLHDNTIVRFEVVSEKGEVINIYPLDQRFDKLKLGRYHSHYEMPEKMKKEIEDKKNEELLKNALKKK